MKINVNISQPNAFFFFWIGQFMYVGKSTDTVIHSHHAIQIAISFSEPFEIITPDAAFKSKAVIIDSDQPHECRTSGSLFLLLNIAPESNFGISLKGKYLANKKISVLPDEDTDPFLGQLTAKLAGPVNKEEVIESTRQFLHRLSGSEENRVFDDRILQILELVKQHQDPPAKINDLAGKVFLSPSRLIHLFSEQVGIPIRKYVLWTKLLTALERMVNSGNVRDAALYAGFSDAPHLNRIFKRMFGLSPSGLLKNSRFVQPSK